MKRNFFIFTVSNIKHLEHNEEWFINIQFLVTVKSDKNRIIRSCGWYSSNYNNKCYHRSGYGGKQDVCTCSTDYCNSAQKTYIAFATMMTLSLAVLIL